MAADALDGRQIDAGLDQARDRGVPHDMGRDSIGIEFGALHCTEEGTPHRPPVHSTSAFKEAFARRRCLVPADGFYEWTGEKGRKTKWLITVADQRCFCFAGLWDHAETADGPVDSFTILTTGAGPDMVPIHHRQPVILARDRWRDWLDLKADPTPLYQSGPSGTLRAEIAPPEGALI